MIDCDKLKMHTMNCKATAKKQTKKLQLINQHRKQNKIIKNYSTPKRSGKKKKEMGRKNIGQTDNKQQDNS